MSVATLEVPNNLNLYSNSVTTNYITSQSGQTNFGDIIINEKNPQTQPSLTINNSGLQSFPALEIVNTFDTTSTTPNLVTITSQMPQGQIVMINTNPASYANGLYVLVEGDAQGSSFGCDNSDNTTYLWDYSAGRDLKIGTNGIERYRIKNAGNIVARVVPNIVFPRYVLQYWTLTTTNATPTVALTYAATNGTIYSVTNQSQGMDTSGNTVSYQEQDSCAFFSGTLTYKGQTYFHN